MTDSSRQEHEPPYGQPTPPYGPPGPLGQYQRGGYPVPGPSPDPTAVVGRRIGQHILDSLLLVVPVAVLFIAILVLMLPEEPTPEPPDGFLPLLFGLLLLAIAGSWLIQAWWPYAHRGQTPAMGWLKLRIVRDDGSHPRLGALSLRWLLLVVDGSLYGIVGLIVMASSQRHQRVGDMAAKTVVISA